MGYMEKFGVSILRGGIRSLEIKNENNGCFFMKLRTDVFLVSLINNNRRSTEAQGA